MKKIITLCSTIVLLTTFSCKSENKETEKQTVTSEQISEQKTVEKTIEEKKIEEVDWSEYSNLAPIEIKDANNKDIFKKYGIEFTGNCYACDLAEFKINKKNFDIVSLCEKNDFYRYKGFKYEKSGSILKIITSDATFIFTKVENEPIYKLLLKAKNLNLKTKEFQNFILHKV